MASRLALASMAALALASPAIADDYDDALRCVVLIGQAKEHYTAENVDALRQAGERLQQRADAARPPDLTDQQKIDRLTAVIDAINEEGGVANEWLLIVSDDQISQAGWCRVFDRSTITQINRPIYRVSASAADVYVASLKDDVWACKTVDGVIFHTHVFQLCL